MFRTYACKAQSHSLEVNLGLFDARKALDYASLTSLLPIYFECLSMHARPELQLMSDFVELKDQ